MNTIYYGMPVPKYLVTYTSLGLNNQIFLATNAEIKSHSYLRAIELYAESAGSIKLDVKLTSSLFLNRGLSKMFLLLLLYNRLFDGNVVVAL